MADEGYVAFGDRDAVAFLLGEAVAWRDRDPTKACILARYAKALADRSHANFAEYLPDFENALPTHDERIWGKPIEDGIIDKLKRWCDSWK